MDSIHRWSFLCLNRTSTAWKRKDAKSWKSIHRPRARSFTWGTGRRNQQSVKPVDQKTPKNIAEQKFGDMNLLVEQTWKKDIPQKASKCLLRCLGIWMSRAQSGISYMMFVSSFFMQHDHTNWWKWSSCLLLSYGSREQWSNAAIV